MRDTRKISHRRIRVHELCISADSWIRNAHAYVPSECYTSWEIDDCLYKCFRGRLLLLQMSPFTVRDDSIDSRRITIFLTIEQRQNILPYFKF